MQPLLVQNATIATSNRVFAGNLLAENGIITRVAEHIVPPAGARVIDATGKVLLPGGVDPHTHFDLDVGIARASDDFYTGSVAAAFGGTTTVIDHMAFGPAGCALGHQAQVYHQLAQPAVIDYGFHGVIQHVDDTVLADMARLCEEEGITSYKAYMTYGYMLQDDALLKVLARAKELGLVICAHCENDAVVNTLREKFVAEGHTQARYHPLSRPDSCEEEAVFRFAKLAKVAGEPWIYIVHLTSQRGLAAIRTVRGEGQARVLAETCPQYLFLDDHLYNDNQEGLKYIMSPPLRKAHDLEAMWGGLESGEIDTIGTDHCPFFFATQKQRGKDDFTRTPNGAPGVELRMNLLFSEGYKKGRLSLPEVVRLCCTRPAEIFGIAPQKGDIAEGADADFVLFAPDEQWTVQVDALHENVDYTPYEGIQLQGRPVLTVSRGEVIVENGAFVGKKGRGRYLRRKTRPAGF